MRWLMVTDDFPPLDGGVASWTAAVATELASRGLEVRVLARDRPGLSLDALGRPWPFTIEGVRGRSFGRWGPVYAALRAWSLLRAGDQVMATTWPMGRWLGHRCEAVGATLHMAFHGSEVTRVGGRRGALRASVARADRCWAVSAFLAAELVTVDAKATVLPAPVELPQLQAPRPTHPRRWVCVARATPLKGIDRVLRVLARFADAELVVVGGGSELAGLRELAAALRVAERVTFTGRLDRAETSARVSCAHLAWLLPRTDADGCGAEGLGLTLLEAAALGVACVGCATGGVPEALGPGLLLDDPDDAAGSAAALLEWWSPDRGAEALAWVQAHHGVHRTVDALMEGE